MTVPPVDRVAEVLDDGGDGYLGFGEDVMEQQNAVTFYQHQCFDAVSNVIDVYFCIPILRVEVPKRNVQALFLEKCAAVGFALPVRRTTSAFTW